MKLRFRHIVLMILLLLAGRMAAQELPVLDSVCPGAERYYRVDGEAGSVYEWILTLPDATTVVLPSDADTLQMFWNYAPGTYILEARQYGENGCNAIPVYGEVIILEAPDVYAGPDDLICSGQSYTMLGATMSNTGELLWTTSGDGTFDDEMLLIATYIPGINDMLGGVITLTLTGEGLGAEGGCEPAVSFMYLTILPELTPEFDPIGPLCLNIEPPELPTVSNNGVAGAWDPDVINTTVPGSFEFTFTPDEGQCAVETTLEVTVLEIIVPEFEDILPLCQYTEPPALPGTSLNGISGDWDPPVISTDEPGDFLFTFTPNDPTQCGVPVTITVTVLPEVIPVFDPVDPLCQYAEPPVLPTVSSNGVTGSWDPETISTALPGTFLHIFTPDETEACALTDTLTVIVMPELTPEFDPIGPLCLNSEPPELPTVSNNGVSGTWEPDVINTTVPGSFEFTFTPDDGQCALTVTITVVVTDAILPEFDPIGPLCQYTPAPELPAVSNNGITGTWDPAVISTLVPGTFEFTFTPDEGQCALSAILSVTIDEEVMPVFDPIDPLCQNSEPPALPAVSLNGITGTWDPPMISTTTAGIFTFTFTPEEGLCAIVVTIEIEILALPEVFAGDDQTIPYGTAAFIGDATATGAEPLGYSWEPADMLLDPTVLNPTTVDLLATTLFTLTVTDVNGCVASDAMTVFIDGGPLAVDPDAIPDVICLGETVQLFANASGGTYSYTYSWVSDPVGFTSDEENPVVSPSETTTYYVEVNDGISTETGSVIVTVYPLPEVYAGADQTIPYGTITTIDDATAFGSMPLTYSWEPAALLLNPTVLNPTTVMMYTTTVFTLTVTDVNGCMASDDVEITITGGPLAVDPAAVPEALCLGGSAQLFANPDGGSGQYTFSWTSVPGNFTSTEQNPTVTPWETTTYTVEVDDGYTTASGSVTVTVHLPPPVVCPPDQQMCIDGEPLELTGGMPEGGTYSGFGVAGGVFDPAVAGTGMHVITYTYTDGNGCSNFCIFRITVNALPEVYAGADQIILYGTSTTIGDAWASGTQPLTCSWSPAGLLVDATVLNPTTVILDSEVTFTLTVTDANGCSASDEMTITITGGALVVEPYALPDAICLGDTVQLFANASGGSESYTYSWVSDPMGFVSDEENPIVSPVVTTVYTVTVDDGYHSISANVTVTVHPLPVVFAGTDQTILYGTATAINDASASGTEPLTYSWTPAGLLVDATVLNPVTLDLETNTSFILTITDANGCQASDTMTVFIEGGPLVVEPYAVPDAICLGDTVQLFANASGGSESYTSSWVSDPIGFSSIEENPIVNPVETTVYTVTVDDGYHSVSASVTVTVHPLPVVFAGANQLIPYNSSTVISDATASGTEPLTYSWEPAELLVDPTVLNPVTVSLTATAIFMLTVTDANGCHASDTMTIEIKTITMLQAIAGPGEHCVGNVIMIPMDVSNFNTVCTFQLKLEYNDDFLECEGYTNAHPMVADNLVGWIDHVNSEITFQWHSDTPLSFEIMTTIVDLVFLLKQAGLGTLAWYTGDTESYFADPEGEHIPAEFLSGEIMIYEPPVIYLSETLPVCVGEPVTITGIAYGTNPPLTYLWTYPTGYTTTEDPQFDSITMNYAGVYTLLVTDAMGCTDLKSITLQVFENPVALFHGQDTIVVDPGYILEAGEGHASYLWNTGETNDYIVIDTAGMYWVEMISGAGCYGIDSVYMKLVPPQCMFIPNAFTPNGDGLNDVFQAISACPVTYYKMYIYNRWGEKLFESNDISIGWDGTKNGVLCHGDAYVYLITYRVVEHLGVEVQHTAAGILILLK